MRNEYIVTYDISDDKRLRNMFKTMRGFGEHVQLSVFRCELSPAELVLLEEAVSKIISHTEDQVLIVNVGPTDGRARRAYKVLGRACPLEARKAFIL